MMRTHSCCQGQGAFLYQEVNDTDVDTLHDFLLRQVGMIRKVSILQEILASCKGISASPLWWISVISSRLLI